MLEIIQAIDTQILLFIQDNLRVPILNPVMVFLSYIGQAGIIWILICVLLMTKKKYRKAGFYTLIIMAVCYILNDIAAKNIIQRPRPFDTIPELTVLTHLPRSYSLPSGHAASSFAAAFTLSRQLDKRGKFYILAVLITLSRPYVGVHYVSDIIVGAAVGTLGALCCFKGITRLKA